MPNEETGPGSSGLQTPASGDDAPARLLMDLAKAHIAARCLHVVAELGVADALGEESAAPEQLAAATGMNADALDRMLRLLATYGIFAHAGAGSLDERYAHTNASRLLRSDDPQSVRSYVRFHGMPAMWDGFHRLHHAAATGLPATDWGTLLAYLAAHPHESSLFNEAMSLKSRAVVPAVVAAYDFRGFASIADIGGGRGHLLEGILQSAPAAKGVLFDLPHVVAEAAMSADVAFRLELTGGDFFIDPLPAAEAYVLMDLLHDWPDASAARIVSAIRRAAPPAARLLIVEALLPEEPGPSFAKTLDVIMLAVTGGRERSRARFAQLLRSAGFRLDRVIPTASRYSIVEAVAD